VGLLNFTDTETIGVSLKKKALSGLSLEDQLVGRLYFKDGRILHCWAQDNIRMGGGMGTAYVLHYAGEFQLIRSPDAMQWKNAARQLMEAVEKSHLEDRDVILNWLADLTWGY
jgi:hypothetical protein